MTSCVATKFLCHDTRHSCRDKDKTTSAKLCRDIAKLYRDRIREESMKKCRDRNCMPRPELGDKDENYVATELSI